MIPRWRRFNGRLDDELTRASGGFDRLASSSRTSGACVALSALLLGCSARSGGGASFATAASLPEQRPEPDGVVVDPAAALPVPTETQPSDTPLVSLRAPLPDRAALRVVAAFFRAAVTENLEALGELATADATAPSKSNGTQPLVDSWRGRMRQLHYQTLVGDLLYQDADVELYRYADLEVVGAGRPPRPAVMVPGDELVRVPLRVVQTATERLFGSELVFLLRPSQGRFRIRQVLEDFQLP
jgi:hypothetical protein